MMQVLPGLLPEEIVKEALDAVTKNEWTQGVHQDDEYKKQVKRNLEMRAEDNADALRAITKLHNLLLKDQEFQMIALPKNMVKIRFNKYTNEGSYGKHSDSGIMGNNPLVRSDLSMTMFLNDPDSYEGGELCIYDKGNLLIKFKGKPGDAILYPSTYVHEVLPVTKGERLAAITWIQSLIREDSKREVVGRVKWLSDRIKSQEGLSDNVTELNSILNNLLRQFAE